MIGVLHGWVSLSSGETVRMNEIVDLTGDPDTGRWTAKYKGKTHRYPRSLDPRTAKKPPKKSWSGLARSLQRVLSTSTWASTSADSISSLLSTRLESVLRQVV